MMRNHVTVAIRGRGRMHEAAASEVRPTGAEPFLSSAALGQILAAGPGAVAIRPPSATIVGTTGADVLTGTAGADYIEDSWGNDQIDGGGGDDIIVDRGGSNILRGGTGNDFIHRAYTILGTLNEDDVNTSLIEAGDGEDNVQIDVGVHQRMTIDLGAGNDQLRLAPPHLSDNQIQITTGSGADRIVLDRAYGLGLDQGITLLVTDFTAGAGGDILDLGGLIEGRLLFRAHPANPFASGHLRLVQDGADVVVRLDIDGNGPGHSRFYVFDVVRLANVSLAALTTYNFAGYALDGGALAHTIASGSAAGEWLSADVGGSDLFGLAGNDRLNGGIGSDLIDGGADNDVIDGGLGDDTLRGGDGNDILTDDYGNDVFEGGAGNDIIVLVRPALLFSLPALHETITIDAGGGDDLVSFRLLPRESAFQAEHSFTLRIDLGAGNDRFEIFSLFPDTRLTLGAGEDHVVISDIVDVAEMLIITDFAAGNGGDVLELDRTIIGAQGWNGVTNPFAAGYLLLQQAGADTLVLFDYDGAAGGDQSVVYTVARLLNVNAATLTAFNFGGYAPGGAASAFLPGGGTAGDDELYGSNGSDVISGGAGNDRIEERKVGDDTLSGGDGNDVILVDHNNYQQLPEVITIDAGIGNDQVAFHGNWGRLNVNLGAGDDRLELFAAPEQGVSVTLGTGVDVVTIDGGFGSQVGGGVITIADFVTGAGGDRLDWTLYALYQSYNEPASQRAKFGPVLNPFLTEHFRLVQSGADTLLQVGKPLNGTANPLVYVTVVAFLNTNAAAFTPYNIAFDTFLPTQNGGAGNDMLNGTAGIDYLFGNDGNDQLNGLGADDLLRGNDGDDILAGGTGDDYLAGGRGDDNLAGGADKDYLDGGEGRNIVDGGTGDDLIFSQSGLDVISGGDGADRITASAYSPLAGPQGSLDAGDGNDVVHIVGNSVAPDYAIRLGAGDDLLYLDRQVGTLLLGSGRDTIVYTSPSRIDGSLVLADFTPGDAGDIFDLKTFMAAQLRFSSGLLLVTAQGLDPFALGYAELRQTGNDVELYVYPDGWADESVYSQTPIRFANTTIAQFTTANFGGYDPHATPNRATIIDGDIIVAAGQTLTGVNITPLQIFLLSGFSTHFEFRDGDGDLVNHGTIVSRLTQMGFGGLAGVVVNNGASTTGSFLNAVDGSFIVESTAVDESGDLSFGVTYGFYAGSQSAAFRNDGYFEVFAASGRASAVLAGYDPDGHPIVNTGTIVVTSAYDAIGFQIGGVSSFSNSGIVDIFAGEVAIGVYLVDYQSGRFTNQGLITVETAADSPFASIGVYATHGLGSEYLFTNAGTIVADIAFYSNDGDSPSTDNRDWFDNSGQIAGDMVMGNGDDRLTNTGAMSGYADLGDGLDVYNGYNGLYSGIVDGGAGNDLLLGGRGEETLLGGTGADQIYGGDGDDLIHGGRGSDALDGGAGFDIISYVDSGKGVAVDFAQGMAEGNGIDRIRNVEGVIGSAYADALAGASGDDYLEGAGGNDVISGGGGADFILGDTGDDSLTGGAGADIFAVSAGDGADVVTDFNLSEDRLEIHGFSAALQIQQVGADTRIVLAANQSVLLRNVQASSLTGSHLVFDPLPLGPPPAPEPPVFDTQTGHGGEGFRLYAGEVIHIVDPAYIHQDGFHLIRNTGVDSHVEGGTANAIVGGTLILEVSADEGVAKGFYLPAQVTVLATGRVEVLTSGAISAVGIHGGSLLNAGHVRVVSTNSAAPVLDDFDNFISRPEPAASSAVGAWYDSSAIFINNGIVEVSSTRISLGVASYNNANENYGFWNSGDILVAGGLGSIGVLFQGQGHPAAQGRPSFVNSGDIVVTDGTALADSVGLAWAFVTSGGGGGAPARIWNSGLIQADYAIKWHVSITPDSGGPATIYNSGELRGRVDLSAGVESIYNRGLITGRIDLREGNDLFDGRGGVQAAGIFGGAGNDILLGGSGIDTIDGGADEDIIAGGGGNDLLTGGAGNDLFEFEAGFGADIITDFIAGTGQDSIRVSGYANYQSVQQQGADTLIVFSATDTILLRNVIAVNLTALDFSFAAPVRPSATIPAAPAQPVPTDFPMPFTPPPAFAPVPPVTLVGTANGETLTGGDGDDTLSGLGGPDLLQGLNGSDLLDGGAGADRLEGGAGNDLYRVEDAGDVVVEAPGAGFDAVYTSLSYTLATGNEIEWLSAATGYGTEPINLTGNEIGQYLTGNDGANVLDGGGGADVLTGLGGNDVYYVDNAGDQVRENAGGGFDAVYASTSHTLAAGSEVEWLSTSIAYGIEGIHLTGNEFANYVIGNDAANTLNGGGGADALVGYGGNDSYYVDNAGDAVFESAGGGFDAVYTSTSYTLAAGVEVEWLSTSIAYGAEGIHLTGNELSNYVLGNEAANTLNGGGGADVLVGYGGNDSYYVDQAGDSVFESAGGGFDAVYASTSYTLAAGVDIEWLSTSIAYGAEGIHLTGNELSNYVLGNEAANSLNGGGGADVLVGYGGNDSYYVDNARDAILENAGGGFDAVYTSTSYALGAGAEVEWLATAVTYGTGAIDLAGNELGNYVLGNDGMNAIDGGGGADILYGYGGADTFAFTTALGSGNIDTIMDFAAGADKIGLDDAIFTAIGGLGALNANAFAVGSGAADASDRIIYNSATGALFYDADGLGGAAQIQFATLNPGLALTASDFAAI